MKETNVYEVRIFEHGDFIIELVKKNTKDREAWLAHKDYAKANFMFGIYGGTDEEFKEMVERNLEDEISLYTKEVMS